MSSIAIVFTIIAVMVLCLATNLAPAAVVTLGVALALYATGILDSATALSGFGEPAILFVASLFVVSASLDHTGVTAWASQFLVRKAGQSRRRLLILTMALTGALAAMIGISGAVAAMLPVATLVAVRLGRKPSQLLMPLAFAAHAGSTLVLTGTVVAVLISTRLVDMGRPGFSYFELTPIGLLLMGGTVAITVLFGKRLLPERSGRQLPEDLSRHSGTLTQQYNLFEELYQLEVLPGSVPAGLRRSWVDLRAEAGLQLIGIHDSEGNETRRLVLAPGDRLLVHGTFDAVTAFAEAQKLKLRGEEAGAAIRAALFNSSAGLAEVVLPPRSALIGQTVFPGMITPNGEMVILAVQRHGANLRERETRLVAGDTLLLQGNWQALDDLVHDPDVLVVDNPDAVRRQTIVMGTGAKRALAVLALMVGLLASGVMPSVITGLLAAIALILLRVMTAEQAFRAINWSTLVTIAALMPLSVAMYQTGAAALLADGLVRLVGDAGPLALLAGLFLMAGVLSQLMSGSATALVIIPIAVLAATEFGISPRTALITVWVATAAAFLTPIASGANMMVQGPAGYRFGDYARLGLPLFGFFFLVATLIVPLLFPLR
jgi:di/tricarboxylate transporter